MAGKLKGNVNEFCRLCASKINELLGINIFEGDGSVRQINKKINTCLPIQVLETDNLPKVICAECDYRLELCFAFRKKTVQSQCLLISMMKQQIYTNKQNDSNTIIDIIISDRSNENSSLPTDLPVPNNILVNPEIILSTTDPDITNHEELDPIAINTDQLHLQQFGNQEMDLNAESQLVIQNFSMINSEPHLIGADFEDVPIQEIQSDCIRQSELPIKPTGTDPLLIKVENEVKTENYDNIIVKTQFDPQYESENSNNTNFDVNIETPIEHSKNNTDSNGFIYEEQRQIENSLNNYSSEMSQFQCNVCNKILTDKQEYLNHYDEHLNECPLCQIVFKNNDELKAHKTRVHSGRVIIKILKPQNHRTRLKDETNHNYYKQNSDEEENSLLKINSEYEPDDDYDEEDDGDRDGDGDEDEDKNEKDEQKNKRCSLKVCQVCGKCYKTNYKLSEHMRKHTGEQPFKCNTCDKAFRSKIGLAQHEAKHTGHYDFACPTCGKGFQCKSYLIVHQRVHSDLKPYPCTTCGRHFKTKQSLLDHMNRHLGVKPYMCDICGRGFITKGLCKSHQKVHSGTDNRQFPCKICKKLFVSKSYLATHLRIHTGEKPFMCEVCGKGFLTRVDLRIHSTMHTGEKSFVCEMCGKAFARRDALRCHRRSHTGERPYRCDICGQTFTQFSPMAIHKRLHTGERPYECEVCGKAFVSRSTMMSHHKKHVP